MKKLILAALIAACATGVNAQAPGWKPKEPCKNCSGQTQQSSTCTVAFQIANSIQLECDNCGTMETRCVSGDLSQPLVELGTVNVRVKSTAPYNFDAERSGDFCNHHDNTIFSGGRLRALISYNVLGGYIQDHFGDQQTNGGLLDNGIFKTLIKRNQATNGWKTQPVKLFAVGPFNNCSDGVFEIDVTFRGILVP